MEWFRWYAGTVTDPKWRVISRRAGQPLHVVLAVWAAVLENANAAENRGRLESFDDEDVAAALDLEADQVRAVIGAMQGKVLEGADLSGWEKRQPKREREDRTAAERKRKQRDKDRDQEVSRQVTPSHALEESRVEEITTTTTSHAADAADTDSEAFHEAWGLYPKRAGGNPKGPARKAWAARMRERIDPAEITAGVRRYAAFVRATGKEGTEYVMQAATMFGPGERWREEYQPPTGNTRPGPQMSGNYGLPPLIVDD